MAQKTTSDLVLSTLTVSATTLASAVCQSGATRAPILPLSAVNITSGTMDNGYLNNAVYQMEEFLGHTVPSPEFEITYGERREHCFTGDTEHPNNVGSRTVHQRYMPAMAQWMMKTAPAGADTRSWVY